jgi:hypothetical protein
MIFSPLIMKDIYGNINKRKFGILDITKKKNGKKSKKICYRIQCGKMWEPKFGLHPSLHEILK